MDAVNIAKYIVDKCITDNQLITNLAVQKILFFIQKEFFHKIFPSSFFKGFPVIYIISKRFSRSVLTAFLTPEAGL